MKRIVVLAGVIAAGFIACETEFVPEIDKYEDAIVVEGLVSNQAGPYEVRLTKSYEYDENTEGYVLGAEVKIIDDLGEEVELEEDDLGYYYTDTNFLAEAGRSYKLYFAYDDKEYETDFQLLEEVQDIDTVYWERKSTTDSEGDEIDGVAIYVDTEKDEGDGKYYKWNYNETWEFEAPYKVDAWEDYATCWATTESDEFNVATSLNLVEDQILRQQITFISEGSDVLAIRYTIEVEQYIVSEEVYNFYTQLSEQQQNVGTLFDETPMSIEGNVKCLTDESEPVLGIFQVSGVKTKRIFIDNSELPSDLNYTSDAAECYDETVDVSDVSGQAELIAEGMVYAETVTTPGGNTGYRYVSEESCYNCTLNGYPNTPPSYWIE